MTDLVAPACTTIPDVGRRSLRGQRPANPGRLVELPKQTHNEVPPQYRLRLRRPVAEFLPAVHVVVPVFRLPTEFRPGRANRTPRSAPEFRVAAIDPVVFCPDVSATL